MFWPSLVTGEGERTVGQGLSQDLGQPAAPWCSRESESPEAVPRGWSGELGSDPCPATCVDLVQKDTALERSMLRRRRPWGLLGREE